jgi:hypothetical protein
MSGFNMSSSAVLESIMPSTKATVMFIAVFELMQTPLKTMSSLSANSRLSLSDVIFSACAPALFSDIPLSRLLAFIFIICRFGRFLGGKLYKKNRAVPISSGAENINHFYQSLPMSRAAK